MAAFSRFVVKHRKAVLVLFLILLIPSVLGILLTRENYDILLYMPGYLNSRQGEEILEKNFNLSGQAFLVVKDRKMWEIKDMKSRIEAVDGVKDVIWVDDFEDITLPVEFMNPDIRKNFFSGSSTILQIQFVDSARSESTMRAINKIRKIIDRDMLFGGEAVIMNDLKAITSKEMVYYMVIAVISIYLILSASMTSFIEPLLFLVSIGIAILLNMGTNAIKGEISFITASIAAVMQLGVSMDYSIFLLHRFEEERQKHASIDDAMVAAMSRTGVPVMGSALTTIAGFVALMFMKNGIGRDLGFVLAKGIIFSLLMNITVLPCLILMFSKYADRHRHRPIIPTFKRVSRWIVRFRWVFLVIIIVLAVPSFLAQRNLQYYYSIEHYLPENSRAAVDTDKIRESFMNTEVVYVVIPDEGSIEEKELINRIEAIDAVDSVAALSRQVDVTIPESFIPADIRGKYVKGNYRYFEVRLKTPSDDLRTFEAVDCIREAAGEVFDEYYVTGSPALTRDLAGLVEADNRMVSIISIGLILAIIGFSYMSLSLPFLLVLVIEMAIWINLSIAYFQGITVSSLTPIVIGAIQLGATVDYAILFTSRYKENRERMKDRLEAIRQTIEDTGRSVLTSALTMIAATLGIALIASIKATGELTMMIGRGAAISMAVIFLGLPSVFLIFDRLIGWTTKNWVRAEKANKYAKKG
ncbi:putative RND superfamily exporter protein [Caldicoprobacter guelmensis]|uniref:efflux RND transporter permease subunit n=1 Tax=Caldicoprobacter guelmensis TaxID=1170224 RepID=UPI00195CB9E0|nr:efflux RND transporter permease subunit [Caldicoprobacter guelmensis]MBM7581954.1 putative RND superfamily exporter protein [Caldicoprobacter guelmensis]